MENCSLQDTVRHCYVFVDINSKLAQKTEHKKADQKAASFDFF